jgi:hypothetical protein
MLSREIKRFKEYCPVKQNCKVVDHFDVVAQSGRRRCWPSCYNNYDLAKEIALFPIPVITVAIMLQNETVWAK